VERYEASKADLPDLIDETNRDNVGDIAEDVVELDRKVGLLTEANAELEHERDTLLDEQVGVIVDQKRPSLIGNFSKPCI